MCLGDVAAAAALDPFAIKSDDLGHGYCTYSFFEQCPHRMVSSHRVPSGALVPHLAHDFDEASHEVRALDVLVGLVEHDELVERLRRPRYVTVGEELEQHDEEAERLVLLDELVAEVDDDEAARADDLALSAPCRRCTRSASSRRMLASSLRWSGSDESSMPCPAPRA